MSQRADQYSSEEPSSTVSPSCPTTEMPNGPYNIQRKSSSKNDIRKTGTAAPDTCRTVRLLVDISFLFM